MSFRVGQMVVCVNDRWHRDFLSLHLNVPMKGRIYTIRAIFEPPVACQPCLWLEEIVNAPTEWAEGLFEAAFRATRFRPVKETSIDIFRQIIAPIEREKART